MQSAPNPSCFLVGTESLLIQCGEILLARGFDVRGVVTSDAGIRSWAREQGFATLDASSDYAGTLREQPFDYLFSITNLAVLSAEVIALPRRMAINFHDGPLPRYAGLHAPVWALIHREATHGVTWHEMTDQVDAGDILKQRIFPIADDETSLTLNTRCYEEAIASFRELAEELSRGAVQRTSQRPDTATYCGRYRRPAAAGLIEWDRPAEEISALVRALDFGMYPNPVGVAKALVGERAVLVTQVRPTGRRSGRAPGTVIALDAHDLTVATASDDLVLAGLRTVDGEPLSAPELAVLEGLEVGRRLPGAEPALADRVTALAGETVRHETFWRRRLASLESVQLPFARGAAAEGRLGTRSLPMPIPVEETEYDRLVAAFAIQVARLCGQYRFDLLYRDRTLSEAARGAERVFSERVPLRVDLAADLSAAEAERRLREEIERVRGRGPFLRDLRHRAALRPSEQTTLSLRVEVVNRVEEIGELAEADLVLAVAAGTREVHWLFRPEVLDSATVERMQQQLVRVVSALEKEPGRPLSDLPVLGASERRDLLEEWNRTGAALPEVGCVHEQIELQAERTPDAVAVECDGARLTYRELDEKANRLAQRLRGLGVGPDVLVGIHMERSLEMMVALLGVHKAGGAYVPLDPSYPRERLDFMVEDAQVPVLLTQARLHGQVSAPGATVLCLDTEDISSGEAQPVESRARPEHLAYVIYTSGSTGKPKGVMVEHRNVTNFFLGMDQRLGTEPGVWLAVTSLSFDISVLELFWTLARGYTVVLYTAQDRQQAAVVEVERPVGRSVERALDFSLFYFSSDESENSRQKYRLLLEGAKFADRRGFSAVWTPERHFHAFGGLYPNPAVTGAAVAAITERVQIRAGSVVLPLHHPVRVAEEWSVVDNLSGGRVGVSFASGWQPNDFVLRPENYAQAKQVMLREIETVRKLWRGETVTLPGPVGDDVTLRILPRPIQAELPFWMTTAGNPESFRQAGEMGANILTHLLGQSVEEVGQKLAIYRAAWKAAGHAGEGHVSLMLHTFVGESDAEVKEIVREPMKAYLKSSISLIKQYAWSFPAFKKKTDGAGGAMDFGALSEEEMEALLEYSFERYYETSGLFGSQATCRRIVERLREIGVDDVACLIDFGVPSELALEHLEPLAVLREASVRAEVEVEAEALDLSIPGLIRTHQVTHLQCTPSMAGMLLQEPGAREAFGQLRKVMIGGEALPVSLAARLREVVSAGEVHNMYGPTETTIWSTTHRVGEEAGGVPVGRPIANTTIYLVDEALRPVPVGVPGELLIGGAGVVRGYLKRPELTAERFVRDPFSPEAGARLYRTGDLARYREDGVLEFLGRLDHQVKIRGYRIELGEIESLLAQAAGVREVVVVAREDVPGDTRLVAYVVGEAGAVIEAQRLREGLRSHLPEFMVPAHVVPMVELPRTPNLKIDRKALPAPTEVLVATVVDSGGGSATNGGGGNEVERQIAGIWQELLGVGEVGVRDNFFDLGGHSLLAVQMHGRLKRELGVEVGITDLFRYPTVQALATHLQRAAVKKADAAPTALAAGPLNRVEARRLAMQRRLPTR